MLAAVGVLTIDQAMRLLLAADWRRKVHDCRIGACFVSVGATREAETSAKSLGGRWTLLLAPLWPM